METVFNSGLVAIGGFTVLFYFLKFSWKFWCGVRVYVLSEYWKTDLRKYGQWAERLHGRKTRVIQADFTEGHAIYPAIAEGLHNLDIGILVNNVGMNYVGALCFFLDVSRAEQRITEVINCNILSVTQMTRLVLPHMVEKGKGLIINVSSEAASHPQPMLTLYSATKIFVTYFSRCLNTEYSSQGVTVQCVAPFIVSTNMTANMTVNAFVKSAPDYAREALNTVGHSSHTSGCLSHALQHVALTIFFPGWLRLSPFCVRQMEKICNRTQENTMTTSKKEN
ncbi:very-long-chain 3-oxoacyl-CoA reductase isoform X2 [Anguilla anguilla]|uniref:very-long-chain 3-oxoacyl-CoA reductase isoform X2 n=1 Tax=Anguilla anguilla TaxID=7936 RepID=UPI0015AB4E7C|nr:very-long-chain 3-oxoacyl-CoA reductase isoform X2 [Anguilla anguilla]